MEMLLAATKKRREEQAGRPRSQYLDFGGIVTEMAGIYT